MSSTEETEDKKAGHPPAVKVGGMRITQHKSPSDRERHDSNKSDKASGDDGDDVETKPPPSPPKQQLYISGAPARGDADFPAQAVQATHVKPLPSHEFRASSQKPNVIHQPRK